MTFAFQAQHSFFEPTSKLVVASQSTTPTGTQTLAVQQLAQRILGNRAAEFQLSVVNNSNVFDWYSYESGSNNQIIVQGSTGASVAAGLYQYIKQHCYGQVTWGERGSGRQVALPSPLPRVPSKVHVQAPGLFRYAWNVCTVSYSAAFWDWARWEEEIDWLALHGYNLPLTFTGQEYVWRQLWREQGLTDAEIQEWFAGPAFLTWMRMGNLRGWAGPLTDTWIDGQRALGQRIAARQRELGMINVLPGFAGIVPGGLRRIYPHANITRSNQWWRAPLQFSRDFLLEPRDPLFDSIGKRFYQLITKTFGATKVFNADTFNEMAPLSNQPQYLAETSEAVFNALNSFDKDGVWLMQGWLFQDRSFWTPSAIRAYLSSVPDASMLILDLWSEASPVWTYTQSYYGKPWIWCMLHNFGGNRGLYGDLPRISSAPISARHAPGSTMVGTGITPEAIEQNPIVYELMSDMGWFSTAPNVANWVSAYAVQRYGGDVPDLQQAWVQLWHAVYFAQTALVKSPIEHVPELEWPPRVEQTLQNFTGTAVAWRLMVRGAARAPGGQPNGPLLYDLADLTRQQLVNLFWDARLLLSQAYFRWQLNQNDAQVRAQTLGTLRSLGQLLTTIIVDLETLLASNENFLFGTWTTRASALGSTAAERAQLQFNAINQVTLWGGGGSYPPWGIEDYAAKQWAGLMGEYFLPRWSLFLSELEGAVLSGVEFDGVRFQRALLVHDEVFNFQNNQSYWSPNPRGSQMTIVNQMLAKYGGAPTLQNFTPRFGMTVSSTDHLYAKPTQTLDIASIATICTADPSCGGFTSQGFITKALPNLIPSVSSIVYVKST